MGGAVKHVAYPNNGAPTQPQIHAEQPDPFQFRNMKAQENMAYWSMWMFIAAVGTIITTAIGTFLIWRQVRLTRQAVEDTSEATKAMRKANEIAERSMKQQLRAYITIEPCGVNESENGYTRVPVLIQNVGETPAHRVMAFSRFALHQNPIDFDPSKLEGPERWLQGEVNDATLGRGVERHIYPYLSADFTAGRGEEIADKKLALIHFGHVIYEDVFGDEHRTHFAFYHWGELLSDETSLRCRFGNTAD